MSIYFLLSPAKNLDETPLSKTLISQLESVIAKNIESSTKGSSSARDLPPVFTQPALMPQACELMKQLKSLDPIALSNLMGISAKLAEQNALRNQHWAWDEDKPFTLDNAKPAVYLFDGDVYAGLGVSELTPAQVGYINQHVGILSGLYGLLRPLDLAMPYRLEMGSKLATANADTLYQFWGDRITSQIYQQLNRVSDHATLINLASNEYYQAVDEAGLVSSSDEEHQPKITILAPRFEDKKAGKYKVISFYAKKARGLMVRYAAIHGITDANDLKGFNLDGYYYADSVSDSHQWVFRREH